MIVRIIVAPQIRPQVKNDFDALQVTA